MTTQEDLLREHRASYNAFVKLSLYAAIGVAVTLGLLALFFA